jgi:hypothetical protein
VDAALGSNVNNLAHSPYTTGPIYGTLGGPRRLGYGSGDKALLLPAMVRNPDPPWAGRMLIQVGTMFGFDFALAA